LKTDSKAASSLQFKGNRIQFEFNTQLLDCLDLAISNLSEVNLLGVQEHLQKAKSDFEKRIKFMIRFADKSPAGWAVVEEKSPTGSPKILKTRRNFERLSDVRLPILNKKSSKPRVSRISSAPKSRDFQATQGSGSSVFTTSLPFSAAHSNFRQPFRAARQVQPSDVCFNCNQRGHWANSPACPLFYKTRGSFTNTGAISTPAKSTTV